MKKHNKITIQIILALSILFSCFGSFMTVSAAENIKVKVNNNYVEFDVQPQLIGGRTMVPLRAIFEAIGATVSWDADTSTITAYNETHIIKATIGSEIMTVNGESHTMDVSPMIIDGRTLVPARFVAEAFDCNVEWNAESFTVSITTKPIDYTQVEKDTNSKTNNETKTDNNSSYKKVKYYSGSNVPDYSYVTGAELKRYSKDTNTHAYELDTDEFVEYYKYLLDNGWSKYSSEEDDDSLVYYMVKDDKMISLSAEGKFHEAWIIF